MSLKKSEKDKLVVDKPLSAEQIEINAIDHNDNMILNPKCYFADGLRRIDYVLTWEKERLTKRTDDEETVFKRKNDYRKRFENKLRDKGMELEHVEEESHKVMVNFVKIHVPFDLMCDYAEMLNFRVPLQVISNKISNGTEDALRFCHLPVLMANKLPYVPERYTTGLFKKECLLKYNGHDNEDTFFTVTQRQRAAYEILATTPYGRINKAEVGVDRMIEEGIYTAAYSLHEGPAIVPPEIKSQPEKYNRRQILNVYWASWSKWCKYQPLDNIREYYGEKIALYFAWLGLYTTWLFPAAIVGILVFLYGVLTMNNYTPSKEVCGSNETYKMCPRCDGGCTHWYLSSVCLYSKITYLFDHPGTIFYAIFIAIWAVSFLESWKRKNATLAFRWNVLNFESEEERPRPEYTAVAKDMRKNPVTGAEEPYFPNNIRCRRAFVGVISLFLMLAIVFIFILGVIVYRILIAIPLFDNPLLRSKALIFSSSTAAVANLILIMCLGKVYEQLAYKLNQWEMHRTESDFEDNLIFKVYLFQFLNFYSSIFYVAFFKGKFNGYPGHYSRIFTLRNEECSNGSCLFELAQQMAIIMVGKQIINNVQELVVPRILSWCHRRSKGLDKIVQIAGKNEESYYSNDYKLIKHEGLFDEYLEMVLQFGFITIFVAAFPLAPLFALINNWLEIRIDANKLVHQTRRPVAKKAEDIGSWFQILNFIVKLSIISNGFLIAFTSDFIPKQLYKYTHNRSLTGYTNFTLAFAPKGSPGSPCRYLDFRDPTGQLTPFFWQLMAVRLAFVILFEHVVFVLYYVIGVLVPDIPEKLRIEIRRQDFMAKQALITNKKSKKQLNQSPTTVL